MDQDKTPSPKPKNETNKRVISNQGTPIAPKQPNLRQTTLEASGSDGTSGTTYNPNSNPGRTDDPEIQVTMKCYLRVVHAIKASGVTSNIPCTYKGVKNKVKLVRNYAIKANDIDTDVPTPSAFRIKVTSDPLKSGSSDVTRRKVNKHLSHSNHTAEMFYEFVDNRDPIAVYHEINRLEDM